MAVSLLDRVRKAASEYEILRELGRGGMAAVFLARDPALGRNVAIKVMLPQVEIDDDMRHRFLAEARTAAHLDHPSIVTVYSVKERDDLIFIVMKYVDGPTFEEVLSRQGKLGVTEALAVLSQAAEGLAAAHVEGIVHRDVKPSNILIDRRGRAVISDFGIAKAADGARLTQTGALVGTPTYMSPEQCRGLPATPASDQYALGIVAYESLAGKAPFTGTIFELVTAHAQDRPEPLEDRRPDVPPGLIAVVNRMITKDPRERWPNLTDVVRELRAFAADDSNRSRETLVTLAGPRTDRGTGEQGKARTPPQVTPAPVLVVSPADPSIEIGEALQLRVALPSGTAVDAAEIEWRSEAPSVCAVERDGTLRGLSLGAAKISAQARGFVGRSLVTVKEATPDAVVVTPRTRKLLVDEDASLVATVLDARGQPIDSQVVRWTSTNVAVCAVSEQGRLIAVSPGKANIRGYVGEMFGEAQISVVAPRLTEIKVTPPTVELTAGDDAHLKATVLDERGKVAQNVSVTWSSDAPALASARSDGTIRGLAEGSTTVHAQVGDIRVAVPVLVGAAPLTSLSIKPSELRMVMGTTLAVTVIGEDRLGNERAPRDVSWTVEDESVVSLSSGGKLIALKEGATRLIATHGTVSAEVRVTVLQRPVARIRIVDPPPTVAPGSETLLVAECLDADGASLTGRKVEWTSSNAKVAQISAAGELRAKGPGSTRIEARSDRAFNGFNLKVAVASAVPEPPRDSGEARQRDTAPMGAVPVAARGSNRPILIGVAIAVVAVGGAIAVVKFGLVGAGTALSPTTPTTVDSTPVATAEPPAATPTPATKAANPPATKAADPPPAARGGRGVAPDTSTQKKAAAPNVRPDSTPQRGATTNVGANTPARGAEPPPAARGAPGVVNPVGGSSVSGAAPPVTAPNPTTPNIPKADPPPADPPPAATPTRVSRTDADNASAIARGWMEAPDQNAQFTAKHTGDKGEVDARNKLFADMRGGSRRSVTLSATTPLRQGEDAELVVTGTARWNNSFGQARNRNVEFHVTIHYAGAGAPTITRITAFRVSEAP